MAPALRGETGFLPWLECAVPAFRASLDLGSFIAVLIGDRHDGQKRRSGSGGIFVQGYALARNAGPGAPKVGLVAKDLSRTGVALRRAGSAGELRTVASMRSRLAGLLRNYPSVVVIRSIASSTFSRMPNAERRK